MQFKKAFPANFHAYVAACEEGEVRPGRLLTYDTGSFANPRYIINFPTKRHWKDRSFIQDIEAGLVALTDEIVARDIRSIAVPPLGAGLGGLDWNEVLPHIKSALSTLFDLRVIILEPKDEPGSL